MSQEIDRNIAPEVQPIQQVEMIAPDEHTLDSGAKLYNIVAGDQELIKLDLIFDAGLWHAKRPLLSAFTGMMLKEGTESYNSFEIAEMLDFYGAYLNVTPGYDNSVVSLLTLKKHLKSALPILKEVISTPTFPESDLELLREKRKHRFLEESEKVAGMAQRRFMVEMFGEGHPYAPLNDVKVIENIKRDDLIAFHKAHYDLKSMRIIACGQADEDDIKLIEECLGKNITSTEGNNIAKDEVAKMQSPQEEIFIEKSDVVQNAICMGIELPNKTHADHHKINFVNTILGGYFGSRLNLNLREDKGYTYGINTSLFSFLHGGMMMIYTEVGSEVCENSITEIEKELTRLGEELISDEELGMVRNYKLGVILRDFDGPFARASSFEAVNEFQLDFDHYRKSIETIKNITPEEIRDTAKKYFPIDRFLTVIAGKK